MQWRLPHTDTDRQQVNTWNATYTFALTNHHAVPTSISKPFYTLVLLQLDKATDISKGSKLDSTTTTHFATFNSRKL